MSDEFRGKSNEQIINENAASLEAKSHYQNRASFNPAGNTTTSLESGLNESGIEGFPKARGIEQVSYGRTGQTGGGTKDQWIPPQEGGDDQTALALVRVRRWALACHISLIQFSAAQPLSSPPSLSSVTGCGRRVWSDIACIFAPRMIN